MNNNELKTKIEELKPWYQNIEFNDEISAVSSHSRLSGEFAWNYIKQLLPESLEGKRILDLGSNAGLFCIRCAQMGATEAIGVERDSRHLKQCDFVKEYFDVSNVKFIRGNLESLPSMNLGKFDIILAIAVLYWVGRSGATGKSHYDKKYRDIELKFIQYITTISNAVIVRARGKKYNDSEYYGKIFSDQGFKMDKLIKEDLSNHEMMLFKKENNG